MDDVTQAAAIDYQTGISSALLTAASNRKEREAAQKYAKEQAELAYQRQIENRDYMNKYNSPLEKRKRLEAAGISAWTEFGSMGNESGQVTGVMTPTMPPAKGLELPATNMFSQLMMVNQQKMQQRGLEASLVAQQIDNENKELQNIITKHFINREMERNTAFKQAEQGEAAAEWIRMKESHDKQMQAYERMQEEYEYAKSRRGYDEKAKNLLISEYEAKLKEMGKNLELMDLEGSLLRQKFSMGTESILKIKEETSKLRNEEEWNKYLRDRDAYLMDKMGIDPRDRDIPNQAARWLWKVGDPRIKWEKDIYKNIPTWNPIDY